VILCRALLGCSVDMVAYCRGDRLKGQKSSTKTKAPHSVKRSRGKFVAQTLSEFPKLELKSRISWISETLTYFLPADFRQATTILLDALPGDCDPALRDEMHYIVDHALRTLTKQGHEAAMAFLGFSATTQVEILSFEITKMGSKWRSPLEKTTFGESTTRDMPNIQVGEPTSFSLEILAKKDERLLIDYVMFFQSNIEALHNGPDGQEILTALGQNTRSGLKKNVSSVSIHSQR
jgi:hypothetical protein